jgi:hypothetical protein
VEDGVDLLETGRSGAKQRPPGFMEDCA